MNSHDILIGDTVMLREPVTAYGSFARGIVTGYATPGVLWVNWQGSGRCHDLARNLRVVRPGRASFQRKSRRWFQ